MTSRIWSLCLGYALCSVSFGSKQVPDPTRLMKLTLQNLETGVVTGTMRQASEGQMHSMQVWQSHSGRTRFLMFDSSGKPEFETIDDIERLVTYDIGAKLLVFQDRFPTLKLDLRMNLIRNNYRLLVAPGEAVANRSCWTLMAIPFNRHLNTYRWLVDRKTSFPLKGEYGQPGDFKTSYVFTAVQYPKSVVEPNISSLVQQAKSIRSQKRTTLDPKRANSQLGFAPILAPKYPLGFTVEEIQVVEKARKKVLAIRLTDGLARCTVFQYTGQAEESSQDTFEANGVVIWVSGDVPSGAKEELARYVQKVALHR